MANLIDKYFNKKVDNCLDCPFHVIKDDTNSDLKVVCYIDMKNVTEKCSPSILRIRCKAPDWCYRIIITKRTNEIKE